MNKQSSGTQWPSAPVHVHSLKGYLIRYNSLIVW